MNVPSAQILLNLWESGRSLSPLERIMLLMEWLFPEQSPVTWPIGRRDANLFRLRQCLFGDTIPCYIVCPQCSEALEFNLSAEKLIANEPTRMDPIAIKFGKRIIRFRLPSSQDILKASDSTALLNQCILSNITLTDKIRSQIEASMAEADPLANLHINLNCPACHHIWLAPFDIGGYLWQEFDGWAHSMLRSIHFLASAYSWPESYILNMSAWRRKYYLGLING